jgi:hypothetical protein
MLWLVLWLVIVLESEKEKIPQSADIKVKLSNSITNDSIFLFFSISANIRKTNQWELQVKSKCL